MSEAPGPRQPGSGKLPEYDYTPDAATYDERRYTGANGEFLVRADSAILTQLVAKTGARVCLDAPVGTGRAVEYLREVTAPDGEPLEIVGCDLTTAMLERTQAKQLPNLKGLLCCNAGALPFPSASFDLVVSLGFFHLFASHDRTPFAGEFARVVRPGGHVLCSFANGWYGGGLGWLRWHYRERPLVRRYLGGLGGHFQDFGEIHRLFPGWEVREMCGNFLPMQRLTAYLGSGVERAVRRMTRSAPLNRFCFNLFYLLRKPAAGGDPEPVHR